MTQSVLTIGQTFNTPTAKFTVKSLKAIIIPMPTPVAKKVGKNAIKLQVEYGGQQYDVKVGKNAYIKIDCYYKNHINPKKTSIILKVGEMAEYDSYNLSYIGKITSITEKTVTIVSHGETYRLKMGQFCYRNWDFNEDKKRKENSQWCD